ncbi:hypothetical protein ACQR10_04335 [Bradyrhizobium sp. HKCCYLRH2060]|uniref:hypothetical protein n=1 Tax=Bradyrhizobium sp. HKCCYLRH2060 TaxID=3420743 RepID=UPI003EB938E8
MSGPLEDYIAHFNEAEAAFRKLKSALHDLNMKVSQASQAPLSLVHAGAAHWPSKDELVGLALDVQTKSVPLQAEFSRLPEEYRKYAPQPQSVGRG